MDIAFARHPAAEIAPGICYGRTDLPLSAAGRRQLPVMARALARHPGACVWTSPARRCRVLADAAARAAGLPVLPHAGLLEMDFGDWEGRAWDDVPRAALDRWAADPLGFAAPGGETGAAFLARVAAAWADIARAGRGCVLVSHGGPLRILPALARGQAPDLLAPAPPVGSITVVAATGIAATGVAARVSRPP